MIDFRASLWTEVPFSCPDARRRDAAVKANDKQMEEFITELRNLDGAVTEFDENLWSSLVDHITVMRDRKVVFTFKGGRRLRFEN